MLQESQIVPSQLLRSRSKAAEISMSAVQKASDLLINALRFFPFASIKTTPKNNGRQNQHVGKEKSASDKVRIKDILRWKSFDSSVIEDQTPLPRSICTTYVKEATTEMPKTWYDTKDGKLNSPRSTNSSSNDSSWSDSDFTAEYLSSFGNEDEYYCMSEMAIVAKRQFLLEENEQHSPVSVLDSTFHHDQESLPISNHNLLAKGFQHKEIYAEENVKFYEETQETTDFAINQKAKELLLQVKARSLDHDYYDDLLFDFFKQEIAGNKNPNKLGFESEILSSAEGWMNRECVKDFHQYLELKDQKEVCVREIEKEVKWNNLVEDKQEIVSHLELCVFEDLIDELLVGFT